MLNIFQIYQQNDCQVTFFVRRESWNKKYKMKVIEVFPRGKYGTAIGYSVPVKDKMGFSLPINEYWGTEQNPKEISCAGCYQWEKVD
jgi:hypothetical protein